MARFVTRSAGSSPLAWWLGASIAAAAAGCSGAAAPAPIVLDVSKPSATPVAADPEADDAPVRRTKHRKKNAGVIDEIGGLRIGDSLARILEIAGGSAGEQVGYDDEKARWESAKLSPETDPIFAIGFDTAVLIDEARVPLFKVFLRDGVARIIKFSASDRYPKQKRFGVPPGCFMTSDEKAVTDTLGPPYMLTLWHSPEERALNYPSRGLDVVLQGGRVQVIDLYGEVSHDEQVRIEQSLSNAEVAPAESKPHG